jgi:hypothetical protein
MKIVAFQGEHGAYSEEACRLYFGSETGTLPCRTFEEIFEAVEQGPADYGAVPVENSTAGSINKSYDLLLDHDLKVHGEILLRVRHNLLTVPGNAAAITQVRSHPQALAQCESYLNRRKLRGCALVRHRGQRQRSGRRSGGRRRRHRQQTGRRGLRVGDRRRGYRGYAQQLHTLFCRRARATRRAATAARLRSSLPCPIRPARSTTRWASSPHARST